jgi:hypothetical protein
VKLLLTAGKGLKLRCHWCHFIVHVFCNNCWISLLIFMELIVNVMLWVALLPLIAYSLCVCVYFQLLNLSSGMLHPVNL